jgi:hypothetical protein
MSALLVFKNTLQDIPLLTSSIIEIGSEMEVIQYAIRNFELNISNGVNVSESYTSVNGGMIDA